MRNSIFKFILIVPALFAAVFVSRAQVVDDYLADEKYLYAATKQVNQFFRRFNGEEDDRGNRYSSGDKQFRDPDIRKGYLSMIFDNETPGFPNDLKRAFIREVNNSSSPEYLDFHAPEWFAEVHATFAFNGRDENAILFLKLEKAGLGTKWVFDEAYFEPFARMFNIDTARHHVFLHPMSHEIDFMNLNRAFNNAEKLEDYADLEYRPDYLSLVLYEIKKGNMRFKSVRNVKFHFFQVKDWYFEISEFNRKGYNKGWLISNLVKVEENQKQALKNYIYLRN